MNTNSLRRTLFLGRKFIISITILTVGATAAWLWQADQTFRSTAYVYVVPSTSSGQTAITTATYAELMRTEPVVAAAGHEVGLSVLEVKESISAQALGKSSLIELAVTRGSGDEAQRIANAVLAEFARLATELNNNSQIGETESAVSFIVTQDPTLPGDPLSNNAVLYLTLALIGGIVLGTVLALLSSARDRSVKGPDDLKRTLGAPILGTIAEDSTVVDEPLLTSLDIQHPRVEAFRVLRTNLQFIDVDSTSKVVVVTSSVPGEGKSTTVANLAIILAQTGLRVAVVEGDLRRPAIGKYLGVSNDVGLTTVLVGRTSLSAALQPAITPGLEVLASGRRPPNPAELVQTRAMKSLIDSLRSQFDVILIDAPPLLPVTDGALLATLADGVLLVVRHGSTKHQEVHAAVDRLTSVDARLFGVVMNMTPHSSRSAFASGYAYTYEDPQSKKANRRNPGRRARN